MGTFDLFVDYLIGQFKYTRELQCFWMAFQGSMNCRLGPNKDRSMHWFHAFWISVIGGYGGSCFAPFWMGRPTSMLTNDLNMGFCIVAYLCVNYTPFDIGYKLGHTLPIHFIMVMFAQLFRTMGIVGYVGVAFNTFKDHPSAYYPIPVFGPILWATFLGNMGSFFMKGFHGHLQNGMPWAFQNGFFCASFYHFYVNDEIGPIGNFLRSSIQSVPGLQLGLDDRTFAIALVSLFMQIMGICQMPHFFGPSFSPFVILNDQFRDIFLGVIKTVPSSNNVTGNNANNGFPIESNTKLLDGGLKKKKSRRKNKGYNKDKEL